MSTNYAGSPTATQSPSVQPTPGTVPTVVIPADGESLNVASITQALKVLADFEAWLMSPRAKSSDWAVPIVKFKSAVLHTHFLVDHLGLPGGRIVQWDESWPSGFVPNTGGAGSGGFGPVPLGGYSITTDFRLALTALKSALHNASIGADLTAVKGALGAAESTVQGCVDALDAVNTKAPWIVKGIEATGISQVAVNAPDATSPRHRYVSLRAGDAINDNVLLYRTVQARADDALVLVLEWEGNVQDITMGGKLAGFVGFCDEGLYPVPGGGAAVNYAMFGLIQGSTHWIAYTRGNGGTAAGVDTGVTATTSWTRFRIEIHGATAADDSARAVRFYINGSLVNTVTTNIPDASLVTGASMSVANVSGGASGLTAPLLVGPMRFRQNLYGSDVI